jgi:hypothetical protein
LQPLLLPQSLLLLLLLLLPPLPLLLLLLLLLLLRTLMTRLLSSCGMVGSLHTSLSAEAPAGSLLNCMSSPRSITCAAFQDIDH